MVVKGLNQEGQPFGSSFLCWPQVVWHACSALLGLCLPICDLQCLLLGTRLGSRAAVVLGRLDLFV